MKKSRVHVTPKKGEGWQVKISGNKSPLSTYEIQKNALEYGREIAKILKTDLVTHGKNGKIRDLDSYGNDPCPPKDQKH